MLDQINKKINNLRIVNQKINGAVRIFDIDEIETLTDNPVQPLKGLVFSVKESFQIKGEGISLGSTIMVSHVPNEDAEIVKSLKKLGATLIARGNLSEFMLSLETDNLLYGRTNNPLNYSHTAGGSSGGDSALVAAGGVDFAIASDIGGSIRIPSAFCGVVGFKSASNDLIMKGFYPSVNHFVESMLGIGIISRNVLMSRHVYEELKGRKISFSSNENIDIILLHPFIDKIKDKLINCALSDTINYFREGKEFNVKEEKVKNNFSLIKRWMYLLADAYGPVISENIEKAIVPFSLSKEGIRRLRGTPMITKELFIQLLLMKLIKPKRKRTELFIDKIEKERIFYHNLSRNGVFIMPTCKILAPLHGKLNKQINLGKLTNVSGPIFGNVLNLSSITIPATKYRDKKTNLVPAIMVSAKPNNESLLFYIAEKLEVLLND